MASSRTDVVIVGAGVIGLTTGVRLAEKGLRVRVLASGRHEHTNSYAAGAIFDPTMARHERRAAWAASTRQELERLAKDDTVPWVRLLRGVEASRTALSSIPDLLPADSTPCAPTELPAGFASGWSYRVPLVDMPHYLRWLEQRLAAAGGEITLRRLTTLDEAFGEGPVVVNCTGFGARELVPDDEVQPIRGQLVVLRNPGLHEFFVEHAPDMEDSGSTYLLPHADVLLLGGNADKDRPDPVVDHEVAAQILRRCREIFPQLDGAEVLGHRVGIRPYRSTVRLEHLALGADRHLVHNYGHGGSGISLSWGCADDVADIVGRLG
jgi:D-amino-acid oxidase